MKFLVVGLGNPGPEFRNTRHNVGYLVADHLAGTEGASFATERYADRAEVRSRGKTLVIIKPNTFMNLSGRAVRYWLDQEKVAIERLLVLTDDIALPFGVLRLRASGGAGGHNGLSDIIATLGSDMYARLRIGIGKEFARGRQSEYVLQEWNSEERNALPEIVGSAAKAVIEVAYRGLAQAMTTYNSKPEG